MRGKKVCKNYTGIMGRISFSGYKLFIFIRIPVGRCYCFRFTLCIKGPTFVYFFFSFVVFRSRDMEKFEKINHVINFYISACERCEIQQWPTQSVYAGI